MSSVIKIENLWKEYRLGIIGHGTLTHDLQSWWANICGKEDPNAKIAPMLAGQEKQIDGDRFWALRDINLEIKQGEILGIIGKNGAGKSTLLKILSRVTAPTKGKVKVKGRIASLLEVGTGFHPELTGRENIFLNGAILGMSKQETSGKLDEIIDFSGTESFIDTPVKRYSSGMYVRLAFAVAAHLEPEILVVDEVLAVGDAEFQKKCLGKMNQVADEGRTVLFVSHNMAAIEHLCKRAVVLSLGGIVENGVPDAVIASYLKQSDYLEISDVDFSSLKQRQGAGGIRFSNIRVINEDGEQLATLKSGMNCTFELSLKFFDQSTEGLVVGLRFQDHLMRDLFQCRSDVQDLVFDRGVLVDGKIYLHILRLPLVEGSYYVTLGVSNRKGLQDKFEQAIKFFVEKGDFYGTGKLPNKNTGSYLIDYCFEINKSQYYSN